MTPHLGKAGAYFKNVKIKRTLISRIPSRDYLASVKT
jgi:hypothetical protein